MSFKDLLFATLTYPDPTPARALRSGVALAARLGGALTLLAVRIDLPELNNRFGNAVVALDRMVADEEAHSAAIADFAATCVSVAGEEASSRSPAWNAPRSSTKKTSASARPHGRGTSASSPSARRFPAPAAWPRPSCSTPAVR